MRSNKMGEQQIASRAPCKMHCKIIAIFMLFLRLKETGSGFKCGDRSASRVRPALKERHKGSSSWVRDIADVFEVH